MQNKPMTILFSSFDSFTCFEPHRFILGKTDVNAVLYGKFTCIGVSSPAGGRVCSILINYALHMYAIMKLWVSNEHTLPPMHVNLPYKNCVYNSLPEAEPLRFETCSKAKQSHYRPGQGQSVLGG
jgi:hypothetical protein